MSQENDGLLANIIVTLWLLGNHFKPDGDFDINDPSGVRDSNYHRIWTFSATVPKNFDEKVLAAMNDSLMVYLNVINKIFDFHHFYPYSVELDRRPDNGNPLLYVSVYT